MPFPLILAAAAAAMPPAPSPSLPRAPVNHGAGRAFVSPMGEPFFASATGADGLATWFAQADANHDGFITADEMTADAGRFFKALDTNGDGEIDPDEITRYEQDILPKGYRYSLLSIPEPVISADSDFNRGVSAEEFRHAASSRFQTLDFNHTGRLGLAGLESTSEAATEQSRHPYEVKTQDVPLDPKGDTESVIPPH